MDTKELLDILVCPRCHGKLEALPDVQAPEGFACSRCDCVYPVREEIPVMLVEASVRRADWDAGRGREGQ